jgi:hypothetical protein
MSKIGPSVREFTSGLGSPVPAYGVLSGFTASFGSGCFGLLDPILLGSIPIKLFLIYEICYAADVWLLGPFAFLG